MNTLSVLSDATAIFMLWLFMSAGIHKLKPANKDYYNQLLNDYGVTPLLGSRLFLVVGLIEVITALMVIPSATRDIGAVMSIALLLTYMLVMGAQLWQGKTDLDCGCAGPGSRIKVSKFLLLRNASLSVLCGMLFVSGVPGINSLLLLTAFTSIFLILLYQSMEQLLDNFEIIKILRA